MPSFSKFLIENTLDTKPAEVKLNIDYHKELNPDIWLGDHIKDNVRQKLLAIAKEFFDTLKMPALSIIDTIITGSMANYNWTSRSDIDIHLIADLDENQCSIVNFREMFDTCKSLWEERHDISIYGHAVEVYVQLKDEDLNATGIYSLQLGEWIDKPKHTAKGENIDKRTVKIKTAALMSLIDKAIATNASITLTKKIKDKIKTMRQNGLEQDGEFSPENLAFKTLRDNGYLEKLTQYVRSKKDNSLSVN